MTLTHLRNNSNRSRIFDLQVGATLEGARCAVSSIDTWINGGMLRRALKNAQTTATARHATVLTLRHPRQLPDL
jgi:hypothetical protein